MHNLTWTTYRTVSTPASTLDEVFSRIVMGCMFESRPNHEDSIYPLHAALMVSFRHSFPICSHYAISWDEALEIAQTTLDAGRGTWTNNMVIHEGESNISFHPSLGILQVNEQFMDITLLPGKLMIYGIILHAMSNICSIRPQFLSLSIGECFMNFQDVRAMREILNKRCLDLHFQLKKPGYEGLDATIHGLSPLEWELLGYDQKVAFERSLGE